MCSSNIGSYWGDAFCIQSEPVSDFSALSKTKKNYDSYNRFSPYRTATIPTTILGLEKSTSKNYVCLQCIWVRRRTDQGEHARIVRTEKHFVGTWSRTTHHSRIRFPPLYPVGGKRVFCADATFLRNPLSHYPALSVANRRSKPSAS